MSLEEGLFFQSKDKLKNVLLDMEAIKIENIKE